MRPPHIIKAHIPIQYGIKGMIAADRSCDRCGKFHPRSSYVSGASVGKKMFKLVCPTCVSIFNKPKEKS